MSIIGNRTIATAAAAAIALTSVSFTPAIAAPASQAKETTVTSGVTAGDLPGDLEVSARQRHRHHRHHSGNRAAVGAMIGVIGTIASIAAAQAARDRYDRRYGYYGDGYRYGPPPAYGYYGPRHYRW